MTAGGVDGWVHRGRAWCVGDDVGTDTHLLPLSATLALATGPEAVGAHLFEEAFPEVTAGARPGDVVVAGRRFAHGNPHGAAWVALRARGLGVVCASVAHGAVRAAVGAGAHLLVGGGAVAAAARTGQGIRADFATGEVELDTGERFACTPLPPELAAIVAAAGSRGWARRQLGLDAGP